MIVLYIIIEHLTIFEDKLNCYLALVNSEHYAWIQNKFIDISDDALTLTQELVSISTDEGLRIKYKELSLEKFWISLKEEQVNISKCSDDFTRFSTFKML